MKARGFGQPRGPEIIPKDNNEVTKSLPVQKKLYRGFHFGL